MIPTTPTREPLAVEQLVSEDARRLAEALDTQHPLPQTQVEECRQLLNQVAAQRPHRRISIADHQRWQQNKRPPHLGDADIDDAAADPIRDHAPQTRTKGKVNRVLSILDELDGNPNRRWKP